MGEKINNSRLLEKHLYPYRNFQYDLLRRVDHSEISTGATVPIQWIIENIPNASTVLNVGCGVGEKTYKLAKEIKKQLSNIQVVGIDINERAIEKAKSEYNLDNLSFMVEDANSVFLTASGSIFEDGVFTVVAEGLFCNLIGINAGRVANQLTEMVKLSGSLWIADCLRVDDKKTEEMVKEKMEWSDEKFKEWQNKWMKRYEVNESIGLDNGTFWVMPLGVDKILEFGNADKIKKLMISGQVERMARHYSREEFELLTQINGMKISRWENKVWLSRTGEPIMGMIVKLEKQPLYFS